MGRFYVGPSQEMVNAQSVSVPPLIVVPIVIPVDVGKTSIAASRHPPDAEMGAGTQIGAAEKILELKVRAHLPVAGCETDEIQLPV